MEGERSTKNRSHEGGDTAHIEADALGEVRAQAPETTDSQAGQESASLQREVIRGRGP